MPNAQGWMRIRKILPDAIAFAVERSGMQCAFSTVPYYHQTGRWLPTEGGKKVRLGTVDVSPTFDASGTLQWAPDYTGDVEAHKKIQEEVDRKAKPNPVPEVRETDPSEKGPDAFGHPEGTMTAEDLAKSNQQALGMKTQLDSKPAKVDVTEETTRSMTPKKADPLIQEVARLVMAIGEALPKTRKVKVQDQLDKVAQLLDES